MTIQLPQFTFLCGHLGQGQIALMKALIAQDDQIIRLDFTYPLQEFLSQLFPESCPAILDPLDHLENGILGYSVDEALNQDFPQIGSNTINNFLQATQGGLRSAFGPAALGFLALRYIRQTDLVQNFDRLLFTDATTPEDIQVFIDEFGHNENLCIHLGSLAEQYGTDKLPCRHIWLAVPDTMTRISQLQKDLPDDRKHSGLRTA